MRERITRELIVKKGFSFVAIEARLAGCRARRPLCPALRVSALGVDGLCALSDLDVAQHEVRDFVDWLREHNGTAEAGAARRLSRPRSLQPVHFDPRGAELSRRGRSRIAARVARERYGCLTPWQTRSRDLWPCRADRILSDLRTRRGVRARPTCWRSGAPTPSTTASASSTPCRTRGSSPTPSATIGSCITARARRGICATRTCSKRCKSLLAFHGADSKAVVWAHNSHVGNAAATEMACARRAQHRPALPRGVRRRGLSDRLRHRQRHGRRRLRLGRPDGGQDACGRRIPRATSGCVTTTGLARFMLRLCAIRGELAVRRSLGSDVSSARSASSTGPRPSSRATTSRPSCRAIRRVRLVRRHPCGDAAGHRRNQGPAGHLSVRGVIRS